MITEKPFAVWKDGTQVNEFTLTNRNNMSVSILDWGATITKILVPDKNGKLQDVALGYQNPADYESNSNYFGATVGRLANRLSGAKMVLGGKTFVFDANENGNMLHSSNDCYALRKWEGVIVEDELIMMLFSPDGDGGFPGNLKLELRFILTDDNTLSLRYRAETDQLTVLNLTNHCYFNLNGAESGNILSHSFRVNASSRTAVDAKLLPTGELPEVAGSAYDLRQEKAFQDIIQQLPSGLDDNFVLDSQTAATVYAPESGIQVECTTTEPGLQVYTGFFLDGTKVGKKGVAYGQFGGFCLEAQHFPDSPNHANFPKVELLPGEEYLQETSYHFSIR